MERTTYMQKKRKGGFTLAEFLVVIAITTILAGVSFVAAIHYQSRLRRLEMDQTAKEIFLAAQNRLSLEKAGGSLERLLAEYPDMPQEEAFRRSREMMYGNKWKAFVLDLSFIPWLFLSEVTFGLVGIFYVRPYMDATNAELYETLSQMNVN